MANHCSIGVDLGDIWQYDNAALRAISSAGYTHRHVSSANIMLTEARTKGVLIDFRYAEQFVEFSQSKIDDQDFPIVKIHPIVY
ncbi:1898_t:CDS:2 [Acaulospora colombiana]|uniref:1898_t:CDS:1 n=1 Tax=Acaulospora colombiana TaxID=27376 RepID=A0ACA9M4Q9_9GLOM|nr:1898_t:CDS:2 [Acaulospora colombiana]